MKKYIIVEWPYVQELMYHEDFDEHACLINEENWIDRYGSSSYFVEEDWIKQLVQC